LELWGTYPAGSVTLEGAVIDLYIGTPYGINSSALEVACGPPGIGAKNQGKFSENAWMELKSSAKGS
jgi:hypothetical protein